ncbi:MAG TPA: 3-phosphoshikimate 1-carboxyvinyltransferase [Actinomycetota bacterium]|nr:3-phosphoshikimate 1-carboxyvinyltransferase [Actinomycetota bacterium]
MIHPAEGVLGGRVRVPGDKSISHRMAILAAVARGTSRISGYSPARDCASTLDVLRALGVLIDLHDGAPVIEGGGWDGLRPPDEPLDCGRSGTTMRLMAGILAGVDARATLTGEDQLLRRPMNRIADPLRQMGADVETTDGHAPITIRGGVLRGITYSLPVASAQVKSAVLLAGLRASGQTTVVENTPTRDHTERLLGWLGAAVRKDGTAIIISAADLNSFDAEVPGDLSSAAPLLGAAAMIPGSEVVVDGVGLNPTRDSFLRLLARMGAEVEIEPADQTGPEPVGTVRVTHAGLRGITVEADEVAGVIDELPLLAAMATGADGPTEVRGAGELRVKESDRIRGVVNGLRAIGADAEELPDGFAVSGPSPLRGGSVNAVEDHRLAMAFAVAGLRASGPVTVRGMESVDDSFPGFVATLESLR